MTNQYTKLGAYTVIPAADLIDLQSAANRRGDTRLGAESLGKRPGMDVIRSDSGALSKVFALGEKSSDGWELADGSATYTPANLGSWTDGADVDYANGLLTTDGGNDAAGRTTQSVTLTAGTYLVTGFAAGEGTTGESPDYDVPRLRIGTAAADDTYGEFIGSGSYLHATAAESLAVKEPIAFTFTLTETDEVFFTLDNVDEAGALQAGSSYLLLNPLEAY